MLVKFDIIIIIISTGSIHSSSSIIIISISQQLRTSNKSSVRQSKGADYDCMPLKRAEYDRTPVRRQLSKSTPKIFSVTYVTEVLTRHFVY